jgi:sporulation-control protein spo0M
VVALQLRLVEARRHWTTADGKQVAEADAMALPDRSPLMPAWTRTVIHTWEVPVEREIEAGGSTSVEIGVEIPPHCGVTSPACVITLNAQADIRGQIDPTGNGHLRISE